jgi:hypothetical protein
MQDQVQFAGFTLVCDRRVVFGADAAHFLETLSGFLSNPASIATEANDKAEPSSKGNVS